MAKIKVHTEKTVSHRLNDSSATRRFYPYDKIIIDWSVPIDDKHVYLPEGYSVTDDPLLAARLSLAEKSFVTRWEVTNFLRNNHIGEHILNQSLLAVLHKTNPYDPAWRYMLHEVAEECQHMTMFNQWVRINPDIRTKGLGQHAWGVPVSMIAPALATRFPALLWTLTLAFEVFGDDFARLAARGKPKNLHPIIQQIGRTHMVEEARHIAFAEDWLKNQVPKLPRGERRGLQLVVENVIGAAVKFGLPQRYGKQLAPYVSKAEFDRVMKGDARKQAIRRIYGPLIERLTKLGVMREKSRPAWKTQGLVPAPA